MLGACAKEDSSDLPDNTPIYQDLKVVFDKPENKTRAFATFRKNNSTGTRLQLTGGSSITFNGNSWSSYTELDHYFYRWNTNGMEDVQFRFAKANSNVYVNTIARTDTNDINVPATLVIDRANGAQVHWVGSALVTGETVTAWLVQGGNTTSKVNVTVAGAQSIQLPPSLFSSLSAGTADLYFSRTRAVGLQQSDGNAGGKRVVEVEARGTVALN